MRATAEIPMAQPLLSRWPIVTALALLLISLPVLWPGIVEYDAVVQYRQLLSGQYDDWHPPIMARLWSWLSFAGPGATPLFTLQLTGYWIGLGLLAQALGGRRAGVLLGIGATPLLLGWMAVVIKDSQLLGALTLATGLIAYYRLRDRPITPPALTLATLCLLYATLVRANAVFSTVPLVIWLLPRPRTMPARFMAMIVAIPAILLLSQPINHLVLHAKDSGVRRTQPFYDLAAIAVRTGDGSASGLDAQAIKTLTGHHCVQPLFWDPLDDIPACQSVIRPWDTAPIGQLYADLAQAAARHPLAYLDHRLAHLNSTERWLVPAHWPLAAPPARTEPNDLGLANPRCCMLAHWQGAAGWLAQTPVGWPILWVAMAIWGLCLALAEAPDNSRHFALALFASALCQETSFTVLSISSDLRYHLWPMLATVLGWLILWRGRTSLRGLRAGTLTIALLLLSGTIARFTLPPPPSHHAPPSN